METSKTKICDQCGRFVDQFTRRYKEQTYCANCYLRCFPLTTCSNCNQQKRIHQDDKKRLCCNCYPRVTPCVRCKRTGRKISKILAVGPFCSSCYRYVKELKTCSVCGKQDVVSRGLSVGVNSPICDGCRHKLRLKCPQCGIRRKLYKLDSGALMCYRCRDNIKYYCTGCDAELTGKEKTICQLCSAKRLNKIRKQQNALGFDTLNGKNLFIEFVNWLEKTRNSFDAAHKQNRYIPFFEKIESFPKDWYLTLDLLKQIDGGYLRRSSMPRQFLESKGVIFDEKLLATAMDLRTIDMNTLIFEKAKSSALQKAILEYTSLRKHQLEKGDIKTRTLRFETSAMKSLLDHNRWAKSPQNALENLLKESPGQRASIFKFVSFTRENTSLGIFMPGSNAENGVVASLKRYSKNPSSKAFRLYTFFALDYFHDFYLPRNAHIHIKEVGDGLEVTFKSQTYWVPSPTRILKEKSD